MPYEINKCSHCGRKISRMTRVCPHCHANLVEVKCKVCGYGSSEADFVGDLCPKCHSAVPSSRNSGTKFCPKCHKTWDGRLCDYCGKLNVGKMMLWLAGIVTIVLLLVNMIRNLNESSQSPIVALCSGVLLVTGAGYLLFEVIRTLVRKVKSA
jgi:hypothetical protein